MTVPTNTVTTTELNVGLDAWAVKAFKGEYDRLAEILGIFAPVPQRAGQTLYQLKVTGELNTADYTEGEEVPLSKYKVEKKAIDVIDIEPYRKVTTAAAINRAGYQNAILETDKKMLSHVRGKIISKFFTYLANGTSTATGKNLQAALAKSSATLGNVLETNGDETSTIVHFVNRMDAAKYLGEANITTQEMFGLTYLADFLGVKNVFLTNKVAEGTTYCTPAENLHIYSLDFANLANAGLSYAQDDSGLIGVAHTPAYDRVSAETNIINGMVIFPEVTDYIVKTSIAPEA